MLPILFSISMILSIPYDVYEMLELQALARDIPIEQVISEYISSKVHKKEKVTILDPYDKRDGKCK